ncbi:arylesterase [Undibacterium sp. Di24W]|uniref:arylesterase n=1 Tax=Undibacterium sp. Di24W TaxID=3413033 RepID=UPI003BF2C68C
MKNLFLFLGRIILTACLLIASTAYSHATSQANNGKILVLGDSISAGLGVTPELTWVNLFDKVMQDKYRLQVVNASVSGETSVGGKNRLTSLLKAHQPRFVIIELGGNDGLRGFSTKTVAANLQEMIAKSHASGAKVLLVGMRIPTSYGVRYGDEFAAVYPKLASSNAIPLVPFLLDKVALDPSMMQADKIHPNDKGQPQLLANVMAVFGPFLKQQNTN